MNISIIIIIIIIVIPVVRPVECKLPTIREI